VAWGVRSPEDVVEKFNVLSGAVWETSICLWSLNRNKESTSHTKHARFKVLGAKFRDHDFPTTSYVYNATSFLLFCASVLLESHKTVLY
jgi:hypothetical protein